MAEPAAGLALRNGAMQEQVHVDLWRAAKHDVADDQEQRHDGHDLAGDEHASHQTIDSLRVGNAHLLDFERGRRRHGCGHFDELVPAARSAGEIDQRSSNDVCERRDDEQDQAQRDQRRPPGPSASWSWPAMMLAIESPRAPRAVSM